MKLVRRPFEHVAVTGGAGFLGSHLCERLVAQGARVHCLDNLLTGSAGNLSRLRTAPRFRFTFCDVTRGIDVRGPVDLVLHLASPASPADCARLPVRTLQAGSMGTQHALDLAVRKRARFLLASASEVYGDPLVHPQPETYWGNVNPIGPRAVFAEAMRYAEALTSAYQRAGDVNAVIVRIFDTYGPRMRADDGRAVPALIRRALAGEPLTVAGDGRAARSICYVDDMVDGLLAAAGAVHPGPINLGDPAEMTVLELARTVRRLTGSSAPIECAGPPASDPGRRRPDVTRCTAALDWRPRTAVAEGLARTIEWFARCAETAAARDGDEPVGAGS